MPGSCGKREAEEEQVALKMKKESPSKCLDESRRSDEIMYDDAGIKPENRDAVKFVGDSGARRSRQIPSFDSEFFGKLVSQYAQHRNSQGPAKG